MLWEVRVSVTAVEVGGPSRCVSLLERMGAVDTTVRVRELDKIRLQDAVNGEIGGLLDVVKEYLR